MRIVRVRHDNRIQYGILTPDEPRTPDQTAEGVVTLLGPEFPVPPDHHSPTGRVALSACELLAPVTPTKVLAVGRNYPAHVKEMKFETAAVPSVFIKPTQSLLDPGGRVVLPAPSVSTDVEHEAELAIVIGKACRDVARADAQQYVAGFTCADDVSARDLQRSDPQITRSKGFDTFCPLGPWIETDVRISQPLTIECRVNQELRQSGTTDEMVFGIAEIIEFISSWTTLMPGDVILTGSPAGSGPLRSGDSVEIRIERVGTLRHRVM